MTASSRLRAFPAKALLRSSRCSPADRKLSFTSKTPVWPDEGGGHHAWAQF
jgi:hypothetical protein